MVAVFFTFAMRTNFWHQSVNNTILARYRGVTQKLFATSCFVCSLPAEWFHLLTEKLWLQVMVTTAGRGTTGWVLAAMCVMGELDRNFINMHTSSCTVVNIIGVWGRNTKETMLKPTNRTGVWHNILLRLGFIITSIVQTRSLHVMNNCRVNTECWQW